MTLRALILAAVLSVTACGTPAIAACITPEKAQATAEGVGGTLEILKGDDPIKRAREFYNALPPESDLPITDAALADMPDGSGHLLVGQDGLFCGSHFFPPNVFKALRRHLVGIES